MATETGHLASDVEGGHFESVGKRARMPSSYQVLADTLRTQIQDGQLAVGERLPTDLELSDMFAVSRGTVRRAYLELVSEGLVQRFPGRGSFPVRRTPYRRSFASVDELLALSVDTVLEVLSALAKVADPDAAIALGLQFDDVLKITYRRLHEGSVFCYTEIYLPLHLEKYLQSAPFLYQPLTHSRETVLGILDREMPDRIAGTRQVVTAVPASGEVAEYIECVATEPVLRIERVHFDAAGRPAEWCVNYFNPDRYVYRLQLQRH